MPLPFRVDLFIRSMMFGPLTMEQRALDRYVGWRLTADEAITFWHRIVEHKWYLSERIGRDVGMRVATIDFYQNIYLRRAERPVNSFIGRRHADDQVSLAA
jgi:Domain of unknown function (DUF4032)